MYNKIFLKCCRDTQRIKSERYFFNDKIPEYISLIFTKSLSFSDAQK